MWQQQFFGQLVDRADCSGTGTYHIVEKMRTYLQGELFPAPNQLGAVPFPADKPCFQKFTAHSAPAGLEASFVQS